MYLIQNKIDSLKYMNPMCGYYILAEAKKRVSATGKTFVTGRLSDSTGSIGFVMWDDCPLTEEDSGKIVRVEAVVDKYRDELQAKLLSVRVAAGYEINALNKSMLVPVAPIDIGEAYTYIGDKLLDVSESPYAILQLNLYIMRLSVVG